MDSATIHRSEVNIPERLRSVDTVKPYRRDATVPFVPRR